MVWGTIVFGLIFKAKKYTSHDLEVLLTWHNFEICSGLELHFSLTVNI